MAGVRSSPASPSEARALGSRTIVMTAKDGRMGIRSSLQSQSRESESDEAIERTIDETIRQYFMRHEPAPRVYARAISAAQPRSAAPRNGSALRSWIAAAASATAALLLVNIAVHFFGAFASRAAANIDGHTGPFLFWLSSTGFAQWINESETVFGYSGVLFL